MDMTAKLVLGKVSTWGELKASGLWDSKFDELDWELVEGDDCSLNVIWGEDNHDIPMIGVSLGSLNSTDEKDVAIDMGSLAGKVMAITMELQRYGIPVEHGDIQLVLRPVWG